MKSMENKEQTKEQEWRKDFEANMLDGDDVYDCGGAMLSAESVWEYIKDRLTEVESQAHSSERSKVIGEIKEMVEKLTIDEMGDGLIIEEVAAKFGVPVSVAANQMLEAEKEKLFSTLKVNKDEKK